MRSGVIFGDATKKILGTEMIAPISWGVRAGDFIFLSGMTGTDRQGDVVGSTMGQQFEQILKKVEAVLADAGASLNDTVKMTKYVTKKVTLKSGYPELAEVTRRYFTDGYFPPSTLVEVKSLMHPDILIEVDVVAFKPPDSKQT